MVKLLLIELKTQQLPCFVVLMIILLFENIKCEIGICSVKESSQIPATVLETYVDYVTYSDMCKKMFFYRPCTKIKEVIRTRVKYTLKTQYTIKDKCCDGFVAATLPTTSAPSISNSPNITHCIPVCTPECSYSRCVGPNLCKCLDGYLPSTVELNHCLPHCDHCTNGTCVHPQLCQCFTGFYWDTVQLNCLPKCSIGCAVYGKCIAPGLCQCNDGFKYNVKTDECEGNCPDGYEWNSNLSYCTAICEKPCKNGECVRPNECQCNENYQLIDELDKFTCNPISKCSPIECNVEQRHSKCNENDVCECENGYQRRNNDTDTENCVAIIEMDATSEIVVSSNVSSHHNRRNDMEKQNCTNYPVCSINELNVINNNTTTIHQLQQQEPSPPPPPPKCLCNKNFKMIKLKNNCFECWPRCKTINDDDDDGDGDDGGAIKNNINETDIMDMYDYDFDRDNDDECINGECISPGVCQCNNGYYIDTEISKYECQIGNCYNCTDALKSETNNIKLSTKTTTDGNKTIFIVIGTVVLLTVTIAIILLIVYRLRRNAILNSNFDPAEGCASMPIYYHEEPSS